MAKLMAMLSDAVRSRMQDRNVLALRKVCCPRLGFALVFELVFEFGFGQ